MAELTHLERAELAAQVGQMSDENWRVEVLGQLRKINGTVQRHNDELFGVPDRQIRGIKEQVAAHELAIDRTRVRFQTVIGLILFIGVGNVVAILTLAR